MRYLLLLALSVTVLGLARAQTPAGSDPAASPDDSVVKMDQVEVSAAQEQTQLNSVDRKIYEVKNDLQATGGSAADLLQNVPSVQVDIDGNVSIRGDSGTSSRTGSSSWC